MSVHHTVAASFERLAGQLHGLAFDAADCIHGNAHLGAEIVTRIDAICIAAQAAARRLPSTTPPRGSIGPNRMGPSWPGSDMGDYGAKSA